VALLPLVPAGGAAVTRRQADEAAWLFDPLRVNAIDLSAGAGALDSLRADPTHYVTAQITLHEGATTDGPYAVGLKLKGHSSFRDLDGKLAFKVKFDYSVPGQRFGGL